jgi:hypothetical protein
MLSLGLNYDPLLPAVIPAYGTSHEPYIEGLNSRKMPSHICPVVRRCNLVNLSRFVVSTQVVAHTSPCHVGVVIYTHIEA